MRTAHRVPRSSLVGLRDRVLGICLRSGLGSLYYRSPRVAAVAVRVVRSVARAFVGVSLPLLPEPLEGLAMSGHWSALAGSEVTHLPGAARAEPVDTRKRRRVTVVLRPANAQAYWLEGHEGPAAPPHPATLKPMSRAELEALYAPRDEHVDLVRTFARTHQLKVVEVSRARHDVVVSGSVEALNRAFGVALHYFEHENGRYLAHDGPIWVPPEMAEGIEAVFGLDERPVHRPHVVASSARAGLSPAQLAHHYGFPDVDASNHRIALIQFSGGFHHDDITAYANLMGLALPTITEIPVMGAGGKSGRNAPLAANKTRAIAAAWKNGMEFAKLVAKFGGDVGTFMATLEVTMDLQLAMALGGGAAIDVYFAPPGPDGWWRVLHAAAGDPHGSVRARRHAMPTVISASWGASESDFGPMALGAVHGALVAVQRKGVLVCCSSGDRGPSNSWSSVRPGAKGSANVNFPASSPAVLACGGTTLQAHHETSTLIERAWNEKMLGIDMASGGGMSGFFPRPSYQSTIRQSPVRGTWLADGKGEAFVGRWVPDVAANASFLSGATVIAGGEELTAGGTSAATPLCAALLTRVSAVAGHPLAGLGAWMYAPGSHATCRDISHGNDDVSDDTIPFYRAGAGWDACTGLGSPDGRLLLEALSASAPNA